MRIGITCYPVYGGSGVVATELGMALAQRGHEIHFIAYSLPFRLSQAMENIYFHEVRVAQYPLFEFPPYSLSLTSAMVDIARYEKLDLLHVHYAIPHATSAVLARTILEQSGISLPVVTTLHGTDITIVGKDPSFAPVVTWSINASDGVTAVSDSLRRETFDQFEITKDIEVVPNFIDANRFQPQDKSALKKAFCPNGEKLIMHVSNFRRVKNVHHTVEVLYRLRQENLPVKLVLAGDGPDRSRAEHLARKRGVNEDVRFLGKQNPVSELLPAADLFLLPSGSESFGLAPLEAMACGVPAVCSDIGGLPELLGDSQAGFLCPLGDVDAFTSACRTLILDDHLRTQMATNAREHAVSKFDIRSIVPQYEDHYRQVLASQ